MQFDAAALESQVRFRAKQISADSEVVGDVITKVDSPREEIVQFKIALCSIDVPFYCVSKSSLENAA